jgi:hypothetical protein
MKASPEWPAPEFKYIQQVVEVSKLPDPAIATVPEYPRWGEGDRVEFDVKVGAGSWTDRIVVSDETKFPLPFAIPKSIFEKGLVTGAKVTLTYRVFLGGVNPEPPQALELVLKP